MYYFILYIVVVYLYSYINLYIQKLLNFREKTLTHYNTIKLHYNPMMHNYSKVPTKEFFYKLCNWDMIFECCRDGVMR